MSHAANPDTQSTAARIEQLNGLKSLLAEWEAQPEAVQIENHNYILGLKKRVRVVHNLIVHRKDPLADIFQRK